MTYRQPIFLALSCLVLLACSEQSGQDAESAATPSQQTQVQPELYNYQQLYGKILYGTAEPEEVRQAMTQTDPRRLGNSIHALHNMNWNRNVYYFLHSMWNMDKEKYPEINWDLISRPPVRIALASTLNRTVTERPNEFLDYIHEHKNDADELTLAQVAVALGLNGYAPDMEFLRQLSSNKSMVVSQGALAALSFMDNPDAGLILQELAHQYKKDDPRSELVRELLAQKNIILQDNSPAEPEPTGTDAAVDTTENRDKTTAD